MKKLYQRRYARFEMAHTSSRQYLSAKAPVVRETPETFAQHNIFSDNRLHLNAYEKNLFVRQYGIPGKAGDRVWSLGRACSYRAG